MIMKRLIQFTIGAWAFLGAQSLMACDYPSRVLVPNGNTATKEDMVVGRTSIEKYVSDMQVYLDCLIIEEKTARSELGELEPEQEQEREDLLNKKYNAAVDEMERLAAQFNSELQAYRSREDG